MKRNRFLVCIVVLALGAFGCDEEDPTDAGTTGTDAGPGTDAGGGPMDAGGDTDAGDDEDAGGTDAGAPMTFQVRVVNNLPGLTGTAMRPGGFHACLYFANADTGAIIGDPNFATETAGPIPFRGVSPYLALPAITAPLNYLAAMYEPANLGDPAACPADPNDASAPEAALIATITPDQVPADSVNTAIASGLLPDTFGATGGALPSVCNSPAAAPSFDQLCTQGSQFIIVADDQTDPASGMIRIRVSNQTVNTTPPSGWTVCYDPSIVPNTPPAEGCVDSDPTDTPVVLAMAAPYGTVTDYMEMAPIQPTVPTPGVGGGIYLRIADTMGCPATGFTAGDSCYPILADWPAGMAPPATEIIPNVADGDVVTIFISGLIQPPSGSPTVAPYDVSFFVWKDNAAASSP